MYNSRRIHTGDGKKSYVWVELKIFCKYSGIEQRTSSPCLPRKNGLAEISIQTVKKKC